MNWSARDLWNLAQVANGPEIRTEQNRCRDLGKLLSVELELFAEANYFPEMFTFRKFPADKQSVGRFCVTNPIPLRNPPYALAGIPFISASFSHYLLSAAAFYLIFLHLLIIDRVQPKKKNTKHSHVHLSPGICASHLRLTKLRNTSLSIF